MADLPETGLPVETPAAAETPATTTETTPEVVETKADSQEPEKSGERTFTQKEVDEIAAKRAARAERKYERQLEQRIAELQAERNAPPPPKAEVAPTREQFGTDEEWFRANVRHEAEKVAAETFAKLEASRTQQTQAQQEREVISKAGERMDAAMEKYPDFEEKVFNPNLKITPEMRYVLDRSEQGWDVAYYLANNPAEANRIASLDDKLAAKEIGKIEAKLDSKPAPKLTKAPPPTHSIGQGKSAQVDLNKVSMDEYRRIRKEQGARWA